MQSENFSQICRFFCQAAIRWMAIPNALWRKVVTAFCKNHLTNQSFHTKSGRSLIPIFVKALLIPTEYLSAIYAEQVGLRVDSSRFTALLHRQTFLFPPYQQNAPGPNGFPICPTNGGNGVVHVCRACSKNA